MNELQNGGITAEDYKPKTLIGTTCPECNSGTLKWHQGMMKNGSRYIDWLKCDSCKKLFEDIDNSRK